MVLKIGSLIFIPILSEYSTYSSNILYIKLESLKAILSYFQIADCLNQAVSTNTLLQKLHRLEISINFSVNMFLCAGDLK